MKARGLSARARLAAESNDPEFVRRYLTHYIRFDLREDEKRAIALFAALLRKHGLAETAKESRIRYI